MRLAYCKVKAVAVVERDNADSSESEQRKKRENEKRFASLFSSYFRSCFDSFFTNPLVLNVLTL